MRQTAPTILFILLSPILIAQEIFNPPEFPLIIEAKRTTGAIDIDGKLSEEAWKNTGALTGFLQMDPGQGEPASYKTEVRFLHDHNYLYVAALCEADIKKLNDIRVEDLGRDFSYYNNDLFGISIDGFLDQRNASVFQVTPFGSQRDLQVSDGNNINSDWDALWLSATSIEEDHWIAEMAIPWKSLRYPPHADKLGIILARNVRKIFEFTSFPAVPRAFSPYRMEYAAMLTGIDPPPPAVNIQLKPYFSANLKGNRSESESFFDYEELKLKPGGDVKWAINNHTVLDLTVNTDFAQADVDEQIVNLSRFSVFFPEKRQFFLENATLFNVSRSHAIQPFFSRRIGLDDEGNPIPLDGGARLVHRDVKNNFGGLLVRQRETSTNPAAHFAILRYARNFGNQNQIGGMYTLRHDLAKDSLKAVFNQTGSFDFYFRPWTPLAISGMISNSRDSEGGSGIAYTVEADFENNWLNMDIRNSLVNNNYHPGSGFINDNDYWMIDHDARFDFRPEWLPPFIRSMDPEYDARFYFNLDQMTFREGELIIVPFSLTLENSMNFGFGVGGLWQNLDEEFAPLDLAIEQGSYANYRWGFGIDTDPTASVGAGIFVISGGYYNGSLLEADIELFTKPIPHIVLGLDYSYRSLVDLGINEESKEVHLVGINTRLAINPRLQLIGSYQRNSFNREYRTNIRFSWEYRPLSHFYIVFNDGGDPLSRNQQNIAKITYLHQF